MSPPPKRAFLPLFFAILPVFSVFFPYGMDMPAKTFDSEFTSESNVFAGISIPYGKKTLKTGKIAKNKGRNALLGGGDIGFQLLFTGVIMKEIMKSSPQFGFLTALIIPVFCCLSLAAFACTFVCL